MPQAEIEAEVRRMVFAESIPVVDAISTDPVGRIWVQRTPARYGEPGPIELITATGKYIGTINGRKRPAAVNSSGTLAAWVERDEMDVERVVVRRLPARVHVCCNSVCPLPFKPRRAGRHPISGRGSTKKLEEGHPISTGEEFVVTLPTEGNREGRAPSRAGDDARDIDGALVRRAQAGERSAFDTLYHRTVERVYATCLRMSADRARAERLTQDAFVLAWRKLNTFRGDSAFTSWLHRLTVNVVLEESRKERRRVARVEEVEDVTIYERSERQDTPELRIALERAIATLPPGARTVLVLHDIEGYTHEEIAGLTGTAIGTTKAQLHRARKLLRAELGR